MPLSSLPSAYWHQRPSANSPSIIMIFFISVLLNLLQSYEFSGIYQLGSSINCLLGHLFLSVPLQKKREIDYLPSHISGNFISLFPILRLYSLVGLHKEPDGGRFWTMQEIREAMGRDILTPNFESEFKRCFRKE